VYYEPPPRARHLGRAAK